MRLHTSHSSTTTTSHQSSEQQPSPHKISNNSRQRKATPIPVKANKTPQRTNKQNLLSSHTTHQAQYTSQLTSEQRPSPQPPALHSHATPSITTSLTQLAATHDINLETHIKQQLQPKPGRINNNTHFGVKVQRQRTSVPKDAGNGLFASVDIDAFTIIGIYTGGETLTKEQVSRPTYKSDYVVNVHGIIRDGYKRKPRVSTVIQRA